MSSAQGRRTSIADAGPQAVTAERPEITGSELEEIRALRAFDAACHAMETHKGAKAGPDWQAKREAYQRTYATWRCARRRAIREAVKPTKVKA